MSYMDQQMYKQIMAENNYDESIAVKLFLKRARAFYKRKRSLMLAEESDRDNKILVKYIQKTEIQRWKAVWDAIDCAKIEKTIGFKFFEDGGGDRFINVMLIQYDNDLSQMTDLEKAIYDYYELLGEMIKKSEEGALAN